MNPQLPCHDPFDDILHAVVSGEARPDDVELLNETLRHDPQARRAYIRAIALEAMLAREFATHDNPASQPASQPAVRTHRWRAHLAVAATIALAAALAWTIPALRHPLTTTRAEPDDAPLTFAVITSLDDASGRIGDCVLTSGLRLSDGILVLDNGLADITLDSGAEITLQGPARLQLESETKSRLDAGRASTAVPEQARGFVLHTPTSYIRDRGASLAAIEVKPGRETDLHVLAGELEVTATHRKTSQTPHILRQRQAVRLTAGTIQPINFQADKPAKPHRSIPPRIPPSEHWSFDSWNASATTGTHRQSILKVQQKYRDTTPELLDGSHGLGLHFDGTGAVLRGTDPGPGYTHARTIACWLRLQPDDLTHGARSNGIIAWGAKRAPGKWQIAINHAPNHGTIGAPRVEFTDGYLIGSTDLRDGAWHHLAVVLLGGPKANVASHVKIYCDGRLDATSGRQSRRVEAESSANAVRSMTIGRYFARGANTYFLGDLDELHVFDGALLPAQINRLMKRNTLTRHTSDP